MATGASSTALLALEKTVRQNVAAQSAALGGQLNAALVPAVAGADTGTGLLSDPKVYAAVLVALAQGQQEQADLTGSGYEAAAAIALAAAALLLAKAGFAVPKTPPATGTATLPRLLASIATAYADTLAGLSGSVRAGFDGVSGSGTAAAAARVLVVNGAVAQAVRQLNARVTAAAVVGVYAGSSETEVTLWRDGAYANLDTRVRKQWVVTSTDPCSTCKALDGATVGVDELFDAASPANLPVWGTLTGPPRHPNCRCRLAFHTA